MSFRRAGSADADLVRELTRAAYARWVPVIGRQPMPMQADYALAVQEHWIELLEDGGIICALIEMIPRDDHLWVENVAVHPDNQGRGFGHRLLARAEEVARDLGLGELRLLTNAAFAANLPFYAGLGFVETAREPFREGFTVYFARRLPG
jgi:N-acetylglutamate synthase-like GNAT family acetyltransferase